MKGIKIMQKPHQDFHIVSGVVIEKDGKILLTREAAGDHQGLWAIPAGHLEAQDLRAPILKQALRDYSDGQFWDYKRLLRSNLD